MKYLPIPLLLLGACSLGQVHEVKFHEPAKSYECVIYDASTGNITSLLGEYESVEEALEAARPLVKPNPGNSAHCREI